MVERGTKVKDDSIGDIIATRDALETDEGANARVIEIIDFASRKATFVEVRGDISGGTPVSVADGVDLDSLHADIAGNAITIGDKSAVILEAWHTQNDGVLKVTPIFFQGSTPMIGETKQTQMGTAMFTAAPAGPGTVYHSPLLSWDCLGAESVGFHITELSASNGVYLNAGVI